MIRSDVIAEQIARASSSATASVQCSHACRVIQVGHPTDSSGDVSGDHDHVPPLAARRCRLRQWIHGHRTVSATHEAECSHTSDRDRGPDSFHHVEKEHLLAPTPYGSVDPRRFRLRAAAETLGADAGRLLEGTCKWL